MSIDVKFFEDQAKAIERYRLEGYELVEEFLSRNFLDEQSLRAARLIEPKRIRSTANLRDWRVGMLGGVWLREDVRNQLVLVHRSRMAGLLAYLTEVSRGLDSSHQEIPKGGSCFRIVPLAPGEVLTGDISRFGRDLREWPFGLGTKEVLCPHWQRTEHGTVRCALLGIEVLSEEDYAKDKAIAHFGTERMADEIGYSWELADEIKVCPYNREPEGE